MATRRDTARVQEHSDPAIPGDAELLPSLREYRTSDLRPSTPQAHVRAMLSVTHDLGEIEDRQAPANRVLQ